MRIYLKFSMIFEYLEHTSEVKFKAHGKDLAEAMRWGAANGAAVVEQIGPQVGLLTLSKMQDRLKENSKIVAKEI